MEYVDVLIIGAGLLGCFAARNLSRYMLDIAVLEQREDVCTGISRANTGIIYQGYDQHPGTRKADLCRQASDHFPELCAALDVPYQRRGLLMLSFGDRADAVLQQKLRQGAENAVAGLRILDSAQVYEMEPALCDGVRHALYAEDTYVVNPWELGIAAFENARANGAIFYFREEVRKISRDGISRDGSGFVVETAGRTFRAGKVLCCAGLQGDRIWEMAARPRVRILPQAADYLVFDTSAGGTIRHVISVEPEERGEGITLVPTVDGNILAGPTRRELAGEPEDPGMRTIAGEADAFAGRTLLSESDASTAREGILELKAKVGRLVPSLPMEQIIRNFAGVRPNPFLLEEDGKISQKSVNDFAILEEDGLYALIGIKTPGLTCANELGAYMTKRILASFDQIPEEKADYDPTRKGIPRAAELIRTDPGAMDALPPAYREMVCRCRHVSEGEVLEAIRRGAVSIDGVKRRIGAGMGRCQGGYCMEKILHLLARELHISPYEVTKDGDGTGVLRS